VSNLLIGLLGALMATNPPAAVSNLVTRNTGLSITVPDSNDPVEVGFKKLMTDDDAAMAEIDQWIRDNTAFAEKGAGVPDNVLNARIDARLATVKKSYEDFLTLHPNHARAHIAFGSFLNDTQHPDEAEIEWQTARKLDPKNPAAWNELANLYGHEGPVTNAFEYYAKAIELDPTEPVYYQNLGTTVFLYRKDAMEYYKINEQQVFNKALDLYSNAIKYDPGNFDLAQDVARTYYGIQPFRTDDALAAWTNAFNDATAAIEREGIQIHFARIKLKAGRFAEARQHLDSVTNDIYKDLKQRVQRNLTEAENKAKGTNATSLGAIQTGPPSQPVK
jgi:tetratricopeptide (TPR) repeat protein